MRRKDLHFRLARNFQASIVRQQLSFSLYNYMAAIKLDLLVYSACDALDKYIRQKSHVNRSNNL